MHLLRSKARLALYALAHFCVDLGCACLVLSLPLEDAAQWGAVLPLYNFFAFAVQMPIGLLADRLDRNDLVAAGGAALVALAYGLSAVPVACAAVAGLGNAMFHVGGGLDVLNESREKSGALGVFVSPGALGIFLGGLLAGTGGAAAIVLPVGLVCLAVLLALIPKGADGFRSGNAPLSLEVESKVLPLIGCLFLVVCLRSYVGMVLDFSWKTGVWAVVSVCAVVLGKTAGGFLADRFGAMRTSVGSLALSAVLFGRSQWPMAGVLAVFLFNMTMPITLWAVARQMPEAKGFSFGLLTFALFLGFVPVWLGLPSLLTDGWSYGLAALLSLILLSLWLRGERVR